MAGCASKRSQRKRMKAKKEARGKKADWWENGLWSEKARPVRVCVCVLVAIG